MTPPELAGRWSLQRRVADRRAGIVGTVTGELVLRPDAVGGLVWDEHGVLTWLGRDVEVSRRYRLAQLAQPDGSWWVFFEDDRPFHPWAPGMLVEHPCRADTYRGLVDIQDADRWRLLWDVTGPGKDQRLVTRLRRAGR